MKKKAAPRKSQDLEKTADAVADGPGAAGAAAAAATADDHLPGKEEIAAAQAALRTFMEAPAQKRVITFLKRLSAAPPQVLLLEGGTAQERLAASHYWALLLNCPGARDATPVRVSAEAALRGGPGSAPSAERDAAGAPCLVCSQCVRMLTHMHRDCFFFDGLAGSIKIDEVRALRAVLGEPAREAGCRMVIFCEAQALGEVAANALLKSLEEPRPGTSFALLAPQREALLPTLVSRSFVLTLPWSRQADAALQERLAPWEETLCSFLQSGRGFFERSGNKGAVDAVLVQNLTNLCRRALLRRFYASQSAEPPGKGLESLLARLPVRGLRVLDEALAECQDSLSRNVNPTLVLEWLATRMYLLMLRPADSEERKAQLAGAASRHAKERP